MNKLKKAIIIIACCFGFLITPTRGEAQVIDVIKEAIKKAIKAIDLQVQRLQNATIELQNIQKQVENTLSKLKLQEIADWTEKQKAIYQEYFDELWKVKSLIAYYSRITEIINKQKQLVTEYKKAFTLVKQDKHFSDEETDYIYSVYTGIIGKSVASIDQILLLVKSFTVQMSDAERLALLNRSADEIETYIRDLRTFTNHNIQLSLQRAKDLQDINTVKDLYGISE
ncbi:conjugal transfer protein TraI [Niastella vici]|uniref:Conjugal transfer protein TraI n=1 Tax=Niastella vici TaxID=1703345 RepID=A0A1V9G4L0_9BACT|nr:conjugal transfer protein TraI [Niastella vici]OQP65484.1 conjugal transfer protein TraI [Niastella vici]